MHSKKARERNRERDERNLQIIIIIIILMMNQIQHAWKAPKTFVYLLGQT